MLLTILKSINSGSVELSILLKKINIRHSKGSFDIPQDNMAEFPNLKTDSFQKEVVLDGDDFKSALKVANKFTLNIDLEAVSNISIQIGKDVTIRSTNKICLFEEKIKGKGDKGNLLFSGKSSNSIVSLLENDRVVMKYNNNMVFFKFGSKEITVVQQHGEFPLYMFDKIMSSFKEAKKLDVDFEEFFTSLKRTSILSDKSEHNPVRFDIKKKSLLMTCVNRTISGQAEETIKASFGEKKTVGYNSKYLIEILSVFDLQSQFSLNKVYCFCIKSGKKKGLIAPTKIE